MMHRLFSCAFPTWNDWKRVDESLPERSPSLVSDSKHNACWTLEDASGCLYTCPVSLEWDTILQSLSSSSSSVVAHDVNSTYEPSSSSSSSSSSGLSTSSRPSRLKYDNDMMVWCLAQTITQEPILETTSVTCLVYRLVLQYILRHEWDARLWTSIQTHIDFSWYHAWWMACTLHDLGAHHQIKEVCEWLSKQVQMHWSKVPWRHMIRTRSPWWSSASLSVHNARMDVFESMWNGSGSSSFLQMDSGNVCLERFVHQLLLLCGPQHNEPGLSYEEWNWFFQQWNARLEPIPSHVLLHVVEHGLVPLILVSEIPYVEISDADDPFDQPYTLYGEKGSGNEFSSRDWIPSFDRWEEPEEQQETLETLEEQEHKKAEDEPDNQIEWVLAWELYCIVRLVMSQSFRITTPASQNSESTSEKEQQHLHRKELQPKEAEQLVVRLVRLGMDAPVSFLRLVEHLPRLRAVWKGIYAFFPVHYMPSLSAVFPLRKWHSPLYREFGCIDQKAADTLVHFWASVLLRFPVHQPLYSRSWWQVWSTHLLPLVLRPHLFPQQLIETLWFSCGKEQSCKIKSLHSHARVAVDWNTWFVEQSVVQADTSSSSSSSDDADFVPTRSTSSPAKRQKCVDPETSSELRVAEAWIARAPLDWIGHVSHPTSFWRVWWNRRLLESLFKCLKKRAHEVSSHPFVWYFLQDVHQPKGREFTFVAKVGALFPSSLVQPLSDSEHVEQVLDKQATVMHALVAPVQDEKPCLPKTCPRVEYLSFVLESTREDVWKQLEWPGSLSFVHHVLDQCTHSKHSWKWMCVLKNVCECLPHVCKESSVWKRLCATPIYHEFVELLTSEEDE